jgi:hypothetical protein
MSQLLPLLIFVGIAVLNVLLKKGGAKLKELSDEAEEFKNREQRQSPQAPPQFPRASGETAEEARMRKFFEALGVPPGSPIPKTTRPSRVQTPPSLPRRDLVTTVGKVSTQPAGRARRPVVNIPPPTQTSRTTPEMLRSQDGQKTESTSHAIDDAAEAVAASARATEDFPEATAAPASASRTDLFVLLRTPDSLRSAVLLREILGPPRGLSEDV